MSNHSYFFIYDHESFCPDSAICVDFVSGRVYIYAPTARIVGNVVSYSCEVRADTTRKYFCNSVECPVSAYGNFSRLDMEYPYCIFVGTDTYVPCAVDA